MLFRALKQQRFEPFLIDHLVDQQGRFECQLDHEFPFGINLYSFSSLPHAYRLNWHERLELFIPVAGEGRFQMGDQFIDFSSGDIIVVDNLRLHGISEFRGYRRCAVVVTFQSSLIYNISSPLCDFVFISPFYCSREGLTPVLRSRDALARATHSALGQLLDCHFQAARRPEVQAGCKAYLTEVLYYLARHFRRTEMARSEYLAQQQRSRRLGKLFDYLQESYAEKVSVPQAAAVVAMSESQFMRFFRRATGMTFVSYLTRLRLNHARRLLNQTEESIADVALAVGFSDQSYFDRRFKEAFRHTPREFRARERQSIQEQDCPN